MSTAPDTGRVAAGHARLAARARRLTTIRRRIAATAPGEHAFWITSRAAGIVALVASSLAVTVGLLIGGQLKGRGLDLRVTHEALSLTTMLALAVHALALLGDGCLRPGIANVTIPFASG